MNTDTHGHTHEYEGMGRLGLALLLAVAAELLTFYAPQTLVFKGAGMALAAAIGLAGVSIYSKGLSALRQGRLNINGLMAVAVTGAFLHRTATVPRTSQNIEVFVQRRRHPACRRLAPGSRPSAAG